MTISIFDSSKEKVGDTVLGTLGICPVKIKKKPVIVDAIRFFGGNWDACIEFSGKHASRYGEALLISTATCTMYLQNGDWIVKGTDGEIFLVRDDVLRETYDIVE